MWVLLFLTVFHMKNQVQTSSHIHILSGFIWVPWVAFHPLVSLKPSEFSHEAWPFCEWWYTDTPIFTYPKLVSCKPALHPPLVVQHGYEKSPSKKG
jgi:hypothetical protein